MLLEAGHGGGGEGVNFARRFYAWHQGGGLDVASGRPAKGVGGGWMFSYMQFLKQVKRLKCSLCIHYPQPFLLGIKERERSVL